MNDRLDLYLDGLMTDDERRAFEREVAADPALQAQVQAQRDIDSALRSEFAYDHRPVLRLAGSDRGAPPTPARNNPAEVFFPTAPKPRLDWRRQLIAVAALIVLGSVVIWLNLTSGPGTAPVRDISPEAAYLTLHSSGFEPAFVCTTQPEFAKAVKDRFGQALVASASPTLQLVGWAYGTGYQGRLISDKTLILMAKVDGHETIVLMDRLERDRSQPAPTRPELKMQRRVVGQMVLYEVTDADKTSLADMLFDPDAK